MLRYLGTGWAGQVPGACHNSIVFVPINYRALLWGWPSLLVERMAAVNSEVVVVGPLQGNSVAGSIDDPADVQSFVSGYAGGISTDRIEVMGPALMQGERQ
jgi:glycerophosphoryl diester phosphodiesterase